MASNKKMFSPCGKAIITPHPSKIDEMLGKGYTFEKPKLKPKSTTKEKEQ